MRILFLVTCVILLINITGSAQSCSCSACGGGIGSFNTASDGATRLSKNEWMGNMTFDYFKFEYSGMKVYDAETARLNAILSNATVYTPGITYGVSNYFTINLQQPLVMIHAAYQNEIYKNFGDASIIGRFTLPLNDHFIISGNAGIKLPTGSRTLLNNFAIGTGTGSVDGIGGIGLLFTDNRISMITQVNYKYATAGYEGKNHGDAFIHQVGLRYMLKEPVITDSTSNYFSVRIEAGLKGEHWAQQVYNGESVPNSGYYILNAEAGVRVRLNKNLDIPVTLSTPIYKDIKGFQNTSALHLQLGVMYYF